MAAKVFFSELFIGLTDLTLPCDSSKVRNAHCLILNKRILFLHQLRKEEILLSSPDRVVFVISYGRGDYCRSFSSFLTSADI
jgi:hypothetical protein